MTDAQQSSTDPLSAHRFRRQPGCQILRKNADEIILINGGKSWLLRGVEPELLSRLSAALDEPRTIEEVSKLLTEFSDTDEIQGLFESLSGTLIAPLDGEDESAPVSRSALNDPSAHKSVAILANSELGQTIQGQISAVPGIDCRLYFLESFLSCKEQEFLAGVAERVITPIPGTERQRMASTSADATGRLSIVPTVTLSILKEIFDAHTVVVCALEGVFYRAILDVNKIALGSDSPCLMITSDANAVVLGPTIVSGVTPCIACLPLTSLFPQFEHGIQSEEILPFLFTPALTDERSIHRSATLVSNEIRKLLGTPSQSMFANLVTRVSGDGQTRSIELTPVDACPHCGPVRRSARANMSTNSAPFRRQILTSQSLEKDLRAANAVTGSPATSSKTYQTVGILGGGTAGYLTALALRARCPELKVTLIESSDIPVIGVGESTVPRLLDFLHGDHSLSLDIVDFYHRVRPTWKFGIKFDWGLPGDYAFHGSFQFGSLLEPMFYNGNIDAYCLSSLLQSKDKVPVFRAGDGGITSLLHKIPFAYHLDNERFVRYLKEEANKANVNYLDRRIVNAPVAADGETIDCLVDDTGTKHSFDLYVDASGFRSELMGKALRSEFVSYETSLYTDSAVIATVPHDGTVKPYTTAESMDNGWCWNIPFEDADHRGYVFSSAYCSVDQAEAEMRRKNPLMGEAKALKFRSGRREHFFKGNVVAVGNAYAFVEPLESTAIQMLNLELDLLTKHLPIDSGDEAIKRVLNEKINGMWDNLRGFLAVHYKFNRKLDTPFWQDCRANTDLSTAEERVALFRERAPLMYSSSLFRGADPFFGANSVSDYFSQEYVYDVILTGQQVPAKYIVPTESKESYDERMRLISNTANWAIPQAEALGILRDNPEALFPVKQSSESWINLRRY